MEVTGAEGLAWLTEPTWMPEMEGLYLDHWLTGWVCSLVVGAVSWLLPHSSSLQLIWEPASRSSQG